MSGFKNLVLKLGRKLRPSVRTEKRLGGSGLDAEDELALVRRQLASKNREIARLRAMLGTEEGAQPTGVRPENVVWIFGTGRTGSSWLSAMMADLTGHARWNEPMVGDVFGYAYYVRAWEWMRSREDYVLGDPYKKVWLNSVRMFFLQGANIRFPELTEKSYLAVKEPNGSIGAPLLAQALPESRMIFLVRDPRDVVSSRLAAEKKESWASQIGKDDKGSSVNTNPDDLARRHAGLYMVSLVKAKEAYEVHEGRKVVVRYEDLRYQTLDTMKRIYSTLEMAVDEDELARVVDKHAWENIPEERKGANKPQRKATPGEWEKDLTPEQAKVVEEITAPILEEFYPEKLGAEEKRINLDR